MSNENVASPFLFRVICPDTVWEMICECLGFDADAVLPDDLLRERPVSMDRDGLADFRDNLNWKFASRGWSARLNRGDLRCAETVRDVFGILTEGPIMAMGERAVVPARPTRRFVTSIVEASLRVDPETLEQSWCLSDAPLSLTEEERSDLRDEINYRLHSGGFDQRVARGQMRLAVTVADLVDAVFTDRLEPRPSDDLPNELFSRR